MRNAAASRSSPADTITEAIIARLEAGTRPWVRPWTGTSVSRPLRACGIPYRGINTLWLWMAAEAGGYSSPYWLTYRQAQLKGGQVRKGERGTVAIFYKAYSKEVEDEQSGEKQDEARRVLKSFVVFNARQVDGLGDRYFPAPRSLPEPSARDDELQRFFSSIPAKLRHFGDEAYYRPVPDDITMPDPAAFVDLDHYHATLTHELAHNAVTRIMPHDLSRRWVFRGIGHAAVRHNQRPSRNASSWSSGRKRLDGIAGAVTRASAFSFIRMSAWM